MEKDKLERFISEHRGKFDDQEPPPGLWDKIDSDLGKGRTIGRIGPWIVKVAAVILLLAGSYLFYGIMNMGKSYTGQVAYSGDKFVFFQKHTMAEEPEQKSEPVSKPVVAQNNINIKQTVNLTQEDSLNAELSVLKAYYASRIEQRKNEIFVFTAGNPKIEKDISAEMEQLDSAYKSLRNDLKDNVDNSEVVSAMIQNYRIRLEILETILEQLKKADNHEKQKKQFDI